MERAWSPSALESERNRIESSLRALGEAEQRLGASQAEEGAALGPAADVASDLAEQELDFGLEAAARRRLSDVEAALRRIDDDHYGTCERCGVDIAVARLRALPWARRCLGCAGGTPHAATSQQADSGAARIAG